MHTTSTARRLAATAAGLAAALVLVACGADNGDTGSDSAKTNEATEVFPVTIEHAFGEAVVKEEPARVATWGWGSTEAAIAAGVYPVAVAEQVWTVGEGNLLPWVEQAYDEAGVTHPVVLPDPNGGAEVPYDEFIAVKPDLILAPYSGLTEDQYDQLTEIAPVVAYPEGAWTTQWDDTIRVTATALGRAERGEEVLAEIDDYFAGLAAEHPEFEGRTIAGAWPGPNSFSLYTERDARAAILTKLGFEIAPSVSKLDTSDGGFYYDLSYEKVDAIDADVLVTYHDTQKEAAALFEDKKARLVPAVAAGRVAQMVGKVNVSSVSPPTALSYDWPDGMPALVEKLAAAVAK